MTLLPLSLRPTGETAVALPCGSVVNLPTCYPVFQKWTGLPPSFTYGGKPILAHNQQPVFAELLIAQLFEQECWNAWWTETYGATGRFCCLSAMPASWKLRPHHIPMPAEHEALIRKIMHAGQTMGCFDVFAWTDQNLVYRLVQSFTI